MMRPSQIPDGRKAGERRPWYSYPLERLVETIGPMAAGVRSLPDEMLAAELDQLDAICAEPERIAWAMMTRGEPYRAAFPA